MKEISYTEIGRDIKVWRKVLHLVQEEIARKLGINSSHISNIGCTCTYASITILIQLGEILSWRIECFIENECTTVTRKVDDLEENPLGFDICR